MIFKSIVRYASMAVLAMGMSLSAAEAPKLAQYKADVQAIVPAFASFGKVEGTKVALLDKAGKTVGTLLLAPAGKYERVEGFNGYINAAVVVTPDNKVAGVAAGENDETPRFFQRVRKAGLLKKWNGLSVKDAAALEVEAVSRATYSSDALMAEVKAALKAACPVEKKK